MFDLEISDAEIDTDVYCQALGMDTRSVKALNGTTRSYGYAAEYYGHAHLRHPEWLHGWRDRRSCGRGLSLCILTWLRENDAVLDDLFDGVHRQ